MTKLLLVPALLCSALTALPAAAEDFYIGATASKSSDLRFTNPLNGKSVEEKGKTGVKLFAGYEFASGFALEGGYSQGAKASFSKSTLGTPADATFKMTTLYTAARYTYAFNEDWSIFGKAGIAHNRFSATDGAGESDNTSSTKPLLGLGVGYQLSKATALTLELEHIGSTRKPGLDIKQNSLQLGVKFAF